MNHFICNTTLIIELELECFHFYRLLRYSNRTRTTGNYRSLSYTNKLRLATETIGSDSNLSLANNGTLQASCSSNTSNCKRCLPSVHVETLNLGCIGAWVSSGQIISHELQLTTAYIHMLISTTNSSHTYSARCLAYQYSPRL